jgi:glyoxylase-like metal-dependent hydrolase (beta-lactamase superfamily II)
MDTGDFYKEIIGSPPFIMKMLLWYVGGSYSGIRVDEVLKGGEEIDFGLKISACSTPGHTPGHIGYYIPEERVFAGGDLIDLETGEGADLNNPHSNYGDGLASLEKVRELDIEHFLPAHGDPVSGAENVRALLERMLENTRRYITDVTAALAEREGTLTDVFNRLMPDTPFTLKAMKMMQVLAVLNHLHQTGEVARRKNGATVWSLVK